MTTNMYYSIKSSVGDLIGLYNTEVPVPDAQTEFRGDIQVHAAQHAALLSACHTWKYLVKLSQLDYPNNNP